MPTKTKTVKAIVASPLKDADHLATEYLFVRDAEKNLAARKKELQEKVRALMGRDSELATSSGRFLIEERKSYSWSLDAIKTYFGKGHVAYLKADDKLVRGKMESEPELAKLADVKVTEALTFRD